MEKLNIAELLRDCPKGMELYSPIFGDVYLDEIRPYLAVVVRTFDKQKKEFLYDGRFGINGECMLFPSKENRDWSTFQRPFKDGDIVSITKYSKDTWIGIFKQYNKTCFESHCSLSTIGDFCSEGFKNHALIGLRLATEEEKQKLFKAIKDNGYKWNPEIKDLETLKVKKFDITTLKAFESRVLVRSSMDGLWKPAVFGFRNGYNDNAFYIVGGSCWKQCIPYLSNEHLCGTTNDCDDFYKTWE